MVSSARLGTCLVHHGSRGRRRAAVAHIKEARASGCAPMESSAQLELILFARGSCLDAYAASRWLRGCAPMIYRVPDL